MTTPEEAHNFWIVVIVFALLSAIGSSLIIILIGLKFRTDFSARLIMYLSIADFCLSIECLAFCAYNMHNGHLQAETSFACQAQPVITWYFMEASILWLMVIAINSYRVTFANKPFTKVQEVVSNVVCWGLPLITVLLPLNTGTGEQYGGRIGVWCSFSESNKGPQMWNILVYYLTALTVISYSYVRIIVQIRSFGKNLANGQVEMSASKKKMLRKLFLFELSYFIVWTPVVVCYIYEAATGKTISYGLELVVTNMLHLQGVFNFILYGINEQLISNVTSRCQKLTSSDKGFTASKYETRISRSNSSAVVYPSGVELPTVVSDSPIPVTLQVDGHVDSQVEGQVNVVVVY